MPGPAISMVAMLRISTDLLPQSLLSYVAFRVALRQTFETLVEQGPDWVHHDGPAFAAYLGEVPILREVPLPVQIELLAETWDRHLSPKEHAATLVDEAVIYAVCEFAATLCEVAPGRINACLRGGPMDVSIPVDEQLASELRRLYLRLSNDGDFLLIGQLLDMPPEEARDWKERLGLDDAEIESMFDLLGRWHIGPEVLGNLTGLVSVSEAQPLARALGMTINA